MDYQKAALEKHSEWKGKLEITSRAPLTSKDDLSIAYTPGVAEPCRHIAQEPDMVFEYTRRWNLVAVVTDGSAVLGLGNIGPEAAMPVMEGKAILFKSFADVDAFPVCVGTQDINEIVDTVVNIAPTFGGINLEDISAPRCFEIERRIIERVDIPVFHDDQHGTAVVVLAALINSLEITGQAFNDLSVVINGCGAAGVAITRLLRQCGVEHIVLLDSKGIVSPARTDLNAIKQEMLTLSNPDRIDGTLTDALLGANVFIGVSVANLLSKEMVRSMADDAMIFALANPDPEILPCDAKDAGARIIGTGRSDFANQVNNVLGFPGIFRGALDVRAHRITDTMKIAAAKALAACVPRDKLCEDFIIPSPLDRTVAARVAEAVAATAHDEGISRL
jgi:malate dehydrogenase (oxaloacetate-decarboxylating)